MGRQLNQIIEGLSGVTAGTSTINVNLDAIEALLTTLQADVADGIIVSSGTANTNLRDGAGNAITSSTRGSQRPLSVQILDSSGNQITSFGTSDVNAKLQDGSGNAITSTVSGSSRRLDVMLSSGGTTGSAVPTNANLMGGTDGTNLRGIRTDTSGRVSTQIFDSSGSALTYAATGTAGTPASDVVSVQGISGGTPLPITNQVLTTTTGTAAGNSAIGTLLITSIDVGGFAEVSLHVTGTWPTNAIVQPEVSNDNSEFVSATVQRITGNTQGAGSSISAVGFYKIALLGARYFRWRVTTNASSGTYSFSYSLNPRTTAPNVQTTVYSGTQAVQGSATGTPLPIRPSNGAATVTAGTTSGTANTSAQALASNTSRQYLLIQNISDTDMYFNFGAAATTSHLLIKSGGAGITFESGFVPTDAVNVICSAASKSYYILSA